MLQKSILLLSKSHIASVGDAVLHQVVALRSLWKSLPYLVAGSASGLETKPFWVSESWQMFQAPALLLAECWAVLWFGCCTVSFRLWKPGSVEMILLQFRGMLLLTPTICQFWLCRYKARVPTWHSVSTENPPAMCVVYKQNASFQVWRKNNILRKKVPRLPGEREKTVILFLASVSKDWVIKGEENYYDRINTWLGNEIHGKGLIIPKFICTKCSHGSNTWLPGPLQRLEGTFGDHLSQHPCSEQSQIQQLRAVSSQVLKIPKNVDSAASLHSLVQCSPTFRQARSFTVFISPQLILWYRRCVCVG